MNRYWFLWKDVENCKPCKWWHKWNAHGGYCCVMSGN